MFSRASFRAISIVIPMAFSAFAPTAVAQWSSDKPEVGGPRGGLPDQMKLKSVSIPDITMGNVQAATMLVPEGWNFQGHIEWRGTPAPFAQRSILLTSADGCGMEFPFIANYQYVANGYQKQGYPAPHDGGRWIGELIAQRPGVSNVRVLKADRDTHAERAFIEKTSQGGGVVNMQIQSWVVRASFDQNGTPMTEEVSFMLMIGQPQEAAGLSTQGWTAVFDVASRAPASRFESMRPLFQMIHRSLRADPRWHARQMEIRTQMLRQQTYDMIETIRQQSARYNDKPGDDAMADWRRKNAADDETHRRRINAVAETHDYADLDGTRVNVPIHYKSVFGDGHGNYVLTNNSYQPGGEFRELPQWR